ncbi:hypothetical protein ACFXQA_05585 [Microbacterium sp. P07]|uniref:hypothetical protein n=1 Tax=Microbacterium sp. P07 TaxID=3366952 RepID=UPI0037467EDC
MEGKRATKNRGKVTKESAQSDVRFLNEDDVVRAVMAYLESEGWTIDSFALSHQRGDDIVASRGHERLVIEAKGDGSSKRSTARYGEPFTRGQVRTHVAVAVARAMRVASAGAARGAVALPGSEFHRVEIDGISPALRQLGISVFWVARDGAVSF